MNENEIQEEIKRLFTGIGAIVEMWNVSYKEFKNIGYSDVDATRQTAALMQVLLNRNGNGGQQ